MYAEIADLFRNAPLKKLRQGAPLFQRGETVGSIHLVRSGLVALQRNTVHGQVLTLNNAGPGSIVAEASVYSECFHCDAVAVLKSEVASLQRTVFLRILESEPRLMHRWASQLAHAVQGARMRSEIRALKTVRDRLDAWLSAGNTLPPKGRIQSVAAELAVSREALYRELARRR